MSDDVETKSLCVRKIGWKRISRNTQRFGWVLNDAEEHTETTETTTYEGRVSGDTIHITPRTTRKTKVRIWLSFYRFRSDIPGVVRTIEFFYNIFFFLRRVIGFLLPWALIPFVIVALVGGVDFVMTYGVYWEIAFFVWLILMVIEGILARIAFNSLSKHRGR